ncbi:hypothetical protein DXG03_006949 [Asterophora parasitica]|uniref:Amidase domain-containing protein n=1 Tax=Asterophora parasitica TaxID=117018 RepID=A0A9P7G5D3_9AGAR|nr:hypothetical protein DXG03_006949 [Asterophora parasitica]
MARDVESVGKVFDVLNVYDARDPTAVLPDARERARTASRRRVDAIGWHSGKRLDGLRVGVPQEYFPREISPSILEPVRRAIRSLKARGAVVVPTSMPNTGYALSAYYVLASAEASSCLARFDGIQYGSHVRPPPGTDIASSGTGALYAHSRTAGFGREVKKRILLGTYALSADAFDNYFLQAQRVRQRVKEDFDGVFGMRDHRLDEVEVEDGVQGDGVDVLLHPSAIQTAPELGLSGQGYVQDVLTVPASLAGVPGLSVPMSGEDGWPVGVSIVGQWGSEPLLFAVGQAVEDVQE